MPRRGARQSWQSSWMGHSHATRTTSQSLCLMAAVLPSAWKGDARKMQSVVCGVVGWVGSGRGIRDICRRLSACVD